MVRAAPENLCPNDRIHTGSGLRGEEGKKGRRKEMKEEEEKGVRREGEGEWKGRRG